MVPSRVSSQRPPFNIVHLGDSYSAGNGARNAEGKKNWDGLPGCYRSPSNWGNQFAQTLTGLWSVTYINRACSGGVIADITNERLLEKFPRPEGIPCPSVEWLDGEYRAISADTCGLFVRPQIEAVDDKTDLVLLTIGGNDARFGNIVKQCFAKGFRDAEDCREAVLFGFQRLWTFKDELVSLLKDLRGRMKAGARIVLVSYPHLLLNTPYVLNSYNAGQAIRSLATRGSEIQQAAVEEANAGGTKFVVFYEAKELFRGHEPDPSAESKNPNGWVREFFDGQIEEWYHYNALGHENLGRALSAFTTFGSIGGSFEQGGNIDLAFVIDTTSSMRPYIDSVSAYMTNLVGQLSSATQSYRVAIVSYRDFPNEAGEEAYPARVDQAFTSDASLIQDAIESLTTFTPGNRDVPETVYSGIKAALGLSWRPGVTKLLLVIGDAPPKLNGGIEPYTGLTAAQLVAESIALDPVEVIGVELGTLASPEFEEITLGTGGSIVSGTSGLADALSTIIAEATSQPFAWMGVAYSGRIGSPITFDARGSYDPSGSEIELFEWDFDGDGTFDYTTTNPRVNHIYQAEFRGYAVVRVKSAGGTALASAQVTVNQDGFAYQGSPICEVGKNGISVISDEDGVGLNCFASSLPTKDLPGVTENNGRPLKIGQCLNWVKKLCRCAQFLSGNKCYLRVINNRCKPSKKPSFYKLYVTRVKRNYNTRCRLGYYP